MKGEKAKTVRYKKKSERWEGKREKKGKKRKYDENRRILGFDRTFQH